MNPHPVLPSFGPGGCPQLLERMEKEFAAIAESSDFNRVASKVRPVWVMPGRLRCEMVVDEQHVNTKGSVHGGQMASLVDIVTARCLANCVDCGMASVELSVSYMAAVRLGEKITLDAEILKKGNSIAFTECVVRLADGRVAAKGKHTLALLRNQPAVLQSE